MPHIAFVTYPGEPGISADDQCVLPHLHALGITVTPWPWSMEPPSPSLDAVILRSCWDYHLAPEAFEAWLQRCTSRGLAVWNPVDIVRWNLRKTYLRDLEKHGAVLPRTIYIDQGSNVSLAALLHAHGLTEAVVKPVISLSAYGTSRTRMATAAQQQEAFAAQLQRGAVMVQEFVAAVQTEGELSLVFLGGVYSHAVRKRPADGDFRVQREHGGRHTVCEPAPWIIAHAQILVASVGVKLPFARVDGIETDGRFLLMELEAIDPELFLGWFDAAPARFAKALADILVP